MTAQPERKSHILLFVLLSIQIALGGCQHEQFAGKIVAFTCTDETITVDHTKAKGVDKETVILCDGKKITWEKGKHVASFEIDFQDPAFGTATHFGTGPGETTTTPAYSAPIETTLYKYTVTTIGDDTGHIHGPFDPHVVGGGGIGMVITAR